MALTKADMETSDGGDEAPVSKAGYDDTPGSRVVLQARIEELRTAQSDLRKTAKSFEKRAATRRDKIAQIDREIGALEVALDALGGPVDVDLDERGLDGLS